MMLKARERASKTSEDVIGFLFDMMRASSIDRSLFLVILSVTCMAVFDLWAFLKFSK
ncbi:MAG: hypothetical protein ABSD75_28805 [Terriglobales bacterium]|jgi:hypothetical protein